jgi:hypothetical protein
VTETPTAQKTTHPLGEDGGFEDDPGHCIVLYDGLYECSVSITENGDAMELSTPLCLVCADDRERMFERALHLNLHGAATRGATISLDANLPVLLLRQRQTVERLDPLWLSDALTQIMNTARMVRRELTAGAVAETEPAVETTRLTAVMRP